MDGHFRIGELAKILSVGKSTIIYWEQNSCIPPAHRENNLMRSRWWNEVESREIADYCHNRRWV